MQIEKYTSIRIRECQEGRQVPRQLRVNEFGRFVGGPDVGVGGGGMRLERSVTQPSAERMEDDQRKEKQANHHHAQQHEPVAKEWGPSCRDGLRG